MLDLSGIPDSWRAIVAFAIAAIVVAVVATPLLMRVARRFDVVAEPGGRGIHDHPIPLLGGVAIMAGILLGALPLLDIQSAPLRERWTAILGGAILMCLLGLVDDWRGISPAVKFGGQALIALWPVMAGVTIDHVNVPFFDPFTIGWLQYPVTVVFIVAVANIVNLADGMDGLAAGISGISATTFAVLALSLSRPSAAVVAAAVAGACAGFLIWNFHPARIFMGDAGSLPLGFLLATLAIQGVMKTAVAVAFVFPLLVLLVPILDTSFVILKRLKYGRPITSADQNHFHHRMLRIGYSQREAALMLYGWCAVLAAFVIAARYLPYRHGGHFHPWNAAILVGFGVVALLASVYVVYALEIIKMRHLRMLGFARGDDAPDEMPVVARRRRRRTSIAS